MINIIWFFKSSQIYNTCFQVDLYGITEVVGGVVTQGSPINSEWVKSFTVRVGVVECDLGYIFDNDDAPVVSTQLNSVHPVCPLTLKLLLD